MRTIKDVLRIVLYPIVILRRHIIRKHRESLCKSCPEKLSSILYEKKFHKSLNLSTPRDLNEKIQWLKLKTDISLWTELADKYKVREFVKKRGLEHILNELYGVWQDARAIDFNLLPDSFVLKTTNGCCTNFIVRDKKKINRKKIQKKLNRWLKNRFGSQTAEIHYLDISPQVIAEKLLIELNPVSSSLIDYKFFCFHGKPFCCLVCYNRNGEKVQLKLYDMEWKDISDRLAPSDRGNEEIPPPESLEEMIKYAGILSVGFPEVRVDFYEINKKVIFGEMTFTSACGMMDYFVKNFLLQMGALIDLTGCKIKNAN